MMEKSKIRQACESRLAQELASLRREKSSGVKILGYTCHAFPAAVVAGLGMRPVRVLCGASADAESAGEKIVRPDVCPLVKTLLGNVSERRSLHADVDIWAGLYTCDQMRRGLHALSESLKQDVYPIHFPATRTREAEDYYADQVQRFVADTAARRDLHFDGERALHWQREHDAAAAVLARAARSGKLSPLDLHSMFHLFFIARPYGLADFFCDLSASSGGNFKSARTVVLTGSPLALEETVLLEELETRGVSVVPLNCTGLNAVEKNGAMESSADLARSLAIAAFRRPACARARPNAPVYDRIADALKISGASGLIAKCLKFCDLWYTERERMRRTFDVPVLVFDSDYAEGGRERLINRIDAFLDTIG